MDLNQQELPREVNAWGNSNLEQEGKEQKDAEEKRFLAEGFFADIKTGINTQLFNTLSVSDGKTDEIEANILFNVIIKKIDEAGSELKGVLDKYTENDLGYLQEKARKVVLDTLSQNAVLQNRGINIAEAEMADNLSKHFTATLEAEKAVFN